MKSIRKPIKLTILGVDTQEYPFLIKFGEDIRQDQRIEQLFGLMNGIFKSDATCNCTNLEILTYQVIKFIYLFFCNFNVLFNSSSGWRKDKMFIF